MITEDDYFDYLIGVTSRNDLIPAVVRRALTDSALLFLGFDLDDWDFRVVFRSIMNREGRSRRADTPTSRRRSTGIRAASRSRRRRRYLEDYFGDADISIFWGSVDDFAANSASDCGRDSDAVCSATSRQPLSRPTPFKRGEKLYGRERETAELLDLLIAERIVLLYSPSGAGKTSLVQAALIPELEDEGFRVLPIMRPGLPPDERRRARTAIC